MQLVLQRIAWWCGGPTPQHTHTDMLEFGLRTQKNFMGLLLSVSLQEPYIKLVVSNSVLILSSFSHMQ